MIFRANINPYILSWPSLSYNFAYVPNSANNYQKFQDYQSRFLPNSVNQMQRSYFSLTPSQSLEEKFQDQLKGWIDSLPFGWPEENGATKEGGFLNKKLNPNPEYYLSTNEFFNIFSINSNLTTEEAVAKLIYFFCDYEKGYLKYFSNGYFFQGVEDQALKYYKDLTSLNSLLELLQEFLKSIAAIDGQNSEQSYLFKIYSQRITKISLHFGNYLSYTLDSRDLQAPHWVGMTDEGIYNNIFPSTGFFYDEINTSFHDEDDLHSFVQYRIDRANFVPNSLIDADFEKWRSNSFFKHYAKDLFDIQGRFEFDLFESVLSRSHVDEVFEFANWHMQKASKVEAEYFVLTHFLLERGGNYEDLNRERLEIEKILNGLPASNIKSLKTTNYLQESWDFKRNFSAFYKNDDLFKVRWIQMLIQMHVPEDDEWNVFLKGLYQSSFNNYFLSVSEQDVQDFLDKYYQENEIFDFENKNPSEQLTLLKQSFSSGFNNQLEEQKNVENLMKDLSLNNLNGYNAAYLLLLLDRDLYQSFSEDEIQDLKIKLTKYSGSAFSPEFVQTLYNQIPDRQKQVVYAFSYRLTQDVFYQRTCWLLGLDSPPHTSFFELDTSQPYRDFWRWFEDGFWNADQEQALQAFPENFYTKSELHEVEKIWRKAKLQGGFPDPFRSTPEEVSQFLNEQISDIQFYENHQAYFDERLNLLKEENRQQFEQITQTIASIDSLSVDELQLLNKNLLSLVDFYFTDEFYFTKKMAVAVDFILEQQFSDETVSNSLLGLPSQILIHQTLLEIYNKQEQLPYSQDLHMRQQWLLRLERVLFDPFNSSHLEVNLHSRYNPNSYAGTDAKKILFGLESMFSIKQYQIFIGTDDAVLREKARPYLKDLDTIFTYEKTVDEAIAIIFEWDDLEFLQEFYQVFKVHYFHNIVVYYSKNYSARADWSRDVCFAIEVALEERIEFLKSHGEQDG